MQRARHTQGRDGGDSEGGLPVAGKDWDKLRGWGAEPGHRCGQKERGQRGCRADPGPLTVASWHQQAHAMWRMPRTVGALQSLNLFIVQERTSQMPVRGWLVPTLPTAGPGRCPPGISSKSSNEFCPQNKIHEVPPTLWTLDDT